jgi:hypothetical protein
MLAQRALIRSARRLPRQLPAKRSYASQDAKLHGVQDNAFNRERAAVKHHAEQTSGIASVFQSPILLFPTSLHLTSVHKSLTT